MHKVSSAHYCIFLPADFLEGGFAASCSKFSSFTVSGHLGILRIPFAGKFLLRFVIKCTCVDQLVVPRRVPTRGAHLSLLLSGSSDFFPLPGHLPLEIKLFCWSRLCSEETISSAGAFLRFKRLRRPAGAIAFFAKLSEGYS